MYLKVVKLNSLDLQAFIPLTFLHSIKIVWVCYRGGGLIIKNNNMIVSKPSLYMPMSETRRPSSAIVS